MKFDFRSLTTDADAEGATLNEFPPLSESPECVVHTQTDTNSLWIKLTIYSCCFCFAFSLVPRQPNILD